MVTTPDIFKDSVAVASLALYIDFPNLGPFVEFKINSEKQQLIRETKLNSSSLISLKLTVLSTLCRWYCYENGNNINVRATLTNTSNLLQVYQPRQAWEKKEQTRMRMHKQQYRSYRILKTSKPWMFHFKNVVRLFA